MDAKPGNLLFNDVYFFFGGKRKSGSLYVKSLD